MAKRRPRWTGIPRPGSFWISKWTHRRCVVTKYETLGAVLGRTPSPSDEKDTPEFILETTTIEYLDGGRHKGTTLREFLEEWELDEHQ